MKNNKIILIILSIASSQMHSMMRVPVQQSAARLSHVSKYIPAITKEAQTQSQRLQVQATEKQLDSVLDDITQEYSLPNQYNMRGAYGGMFKPTGMLLAPAWNYKEDPYKVLGVSKDLSNVSEAAIKKAYKQAALKTHPDIGGSKEQFRKVNEAYEFLKYLKTTGQMSYSFNQEAKSSAKKEEPVVSEEAKKQKFQAYKSYGIKRIHHKIKTVMNKYNYAILKFYIMPELLLISSEKEKFCQIIQQYLEEYFAIINIGQPRDEQFAFDQKDRTTAQVEYLRKVTLETQKILKELNDEYVKSTGQVSNPVSANITDDFFNGIYTFDKIVKQKDASTPLGISAIDLVSNDFKYKGWSALWHRWILPLMIGGASYLHYKAYKLNNPTTKEEKIRTVLWKARGLPSSSTFWHDKRLVLQDVKQIQFLVIKLRNELSSEEFKEFIDKLYDNIKHVNIEKKDFLYKELTNLKNFIIHEHSLSHREMSMMNTPHLAA